jgi:hypothetical protein
MGPPHDGVRSAGVGMSTARSRRLGDPGRIGAHAIAATSPWQGQPSAGTRRNSARGAQAAAWFDQRNSVLLRHIRCRMTVLHRMWVDGTTFRWGKEAVMA